MKKLKNSIKNKYENNKKTIWIVFLSVFVLGFIAHGFAFANLEFSHDSLNEFDAELFGNGLRLQFGKFLVPLYRMITRGVVAIPWIIGILSIIYIAIGALLIVKMFDIKSKLSMVLVSGICVTNMTVIATGASFIHDLDCNMLAFMLASLGAYLWAKYDKGYLIGIIVCMLSLGIYQSYISVAITLIIFYSILSLLNNDDYKKVLKKGTKGMIMILGSGVLYAVMLKVALAITNTQLVSGRGSSLDIAIGKSFKDIIYGVIKSYLEVPYKLLFTQFMYPKWFVITVCLILIAIAGIIILFMFSKIKIQSRLLVIFLIAIMPFGMNFAGVLALGNAHDLMLYSIWLTYIFAILVVFSYCKKSQKTAKNDIIKGISVLLVGLFLANNIYTANAIYLNKKMGYDATLSYMTRVVYSIENTEGYKRGETKIVLVGSPEGMHSTDNLNKYNEIMGNSTPYSLWISNSRRSTAYFKYVLLNDAQFADEDTFVQMNLDDEVVDMPIYPADGSIKYIDDILVVKLGEPYISK